MNIYVAFFIGFVLGFAGAMITVVLDTLHD
jgi:hypothetical protein